MAPLAHVLTDLRRGIPILVIATLAGGAVGGAAALREKETFTATAELLIAARTWEDRGAPVKPEELLALLDGGVLGPAAAAAGTTASLAGAVSISRRPTPGIYHLSVTLPDGEAARRAADAVARGLAERHAAYRTEKLEHVQASLVPAVAGAREARERAEAAYLAHLDGGSLELARAVHERAPTAATAAALGKAEAERERLRRQLDRAAAEEHRFVEARTRAYLDLDAREARVRLGAPAGPAVASRRPAVARKALSGGALGFVVAFGGVLAFAEFRRRPAGEPGIAA